MPVVLFFWRGGGIWGGLVAPESAFKHTYRGVLPPPPSSWQLVTGYVPRRLRASVAWAAARPRTAARPTPALPYHHHVAALSPAAFHSTPTALPPPPLHHPLVFVLSIVALRVPSPVQDPPRGGPGRLALAPSPQAPFVSSPPRPPAPCGRTVVPHLSGGVSGLGREVGAPSAGAPFCVAETPRTSTASPVGDPCRGRRRHWSTPRVSNNTRVSSNAAGKPPVPSAAAPAAATAAAGLAS